MTAKHKKFCDISFQRHNKMARVGFERLPFQSRLPTLRRF